MNSGIAMDEWYVAELERIGMLMIPYLCEHTGFSADMVRTFLDAQNRFWEEQRGAFELFRSLSPDDDGTEDR